MAKKNLKKSSFFTINNETKEVGLVNMKDFTPYESPVPGFYRITLFHSLMGTRVEIKQRDIAVPASAMSTVKTILDIQEIEHLFGERSLAIHKAMNIPAKVGYLLHGKQGAGKTTTMLAVANFLIEKFGAIAFQVNGADGVEVAYDFIDKCRKLNPNQMALVLFDECEDDMENREDKMKQLLDSDITPSNFVFLASTNYIEDIPETIKDRPSRFKHVIDCSDLNGEEDQVYQIFKAMNVDLPENLKLSDSQIKSLTPKYTHKTIDELKHAFVTEASLVPVVATKAKKPRKVVSTELN